MTALVCGLALTFALPNSARAAEVTGTWETVSSVPYPDGPTLFAIDALAANHIWAVGLSTSGFPHAQRWDGAQWTSFALPPVAGAGGSTALRAVTTISTTDAWAVGDNGSGTPFAMRWNGSVWTQVELPALPGFVSLTGVSAVSASEVWAVGYSATDGYRTLTLRWNGTVWTVVPSPNPGTTTIPLNYLHAVHARSSGDVWAVGVYLPQGKGKATLAQQGLTLRWNGSSWKHVATPALNGVNGSNTYSRLDGVHGRAANDAWAVGTLGNKTLALRWNGIAWSAVPTPADQFQGYLSSVSAVASDDVWAVGVSRLPGSGYGFENPTYRNFSLIVHWNGLAWTQVASPNPILNATDLRGSTIVGAGEVWGAGMLGFTARYRAP